MPEYVLAIGFAATIIFAFVYPATMIELDLPINPLLVRRGIREKREYKQIRRISELEHDLGYIPCSYDNCYSCQRQIQHVPSYEVDNNIIDLWNKEVSLKKPRPLLPRG